MKKILHILSILLFTSSLIAKTEKKPWTVLTYIAGDNNLEYYINSDIEEMQKGANDNAHVLAFVNTHRFRENKLARRLVITKNKIAQDGEDLLNLDSGKPETVIQAGLWAIENYPSEKVAIILWNHGAGSLNRSTIINKKIKEMIAHRGVCYDDTTGNYLKDYDLIKIFKTLSQKIGDKINIVAFDACLMADIELAYTINPYVKYLVASQETIAGTGYEYKLLLDRLTEDKLGSKKFAQSMVEAYDECYKKDSDDYTLSATKLSRVDDLVDNLEKVAEKLVKLLENDKDHSVYDAIKSAAYTSKNIRFDEPDYIDLYNILYRIYRKLNHMNISSSDKKELKEELLDCMYSIRNSIVREVSNPKYYAVKGLSIYFPEKKIHDSYEKLFWSSKTNWLKFLHKFFDSSNNNDSLLSDILN